VFPRDIVCLRNISVDLLRQGVTENNNNNNNNNNKETVDKLSDQRKVSVKRFEGLITS
jgi:hypothetical protein